MKKLKMLVSIHVFSMKSLTLNPFVHLKRVLQDLGFEICMLWVPVGGEEGIGIALWLVSDCTTGPHTA